MESLRKLLAEAGTDEDPDFHNEDNRPEDVLEEIFSDHEMIRNRKRTEILKIEWRKIKCRQNIRCHNIVSLLPGTKGPAKDVTSPAKSSELFINDNIIHLIVE
ncbi:hypothetical protein AVEN_63480-1 [Araneus ventricosus]|uniref:Uncharacterized protein n=1 Tax=Araneus ventricosus TaxID=182803 RepID=A0A4Y2CSC9_ARAVE|nr:hypothetical protein AVEN_63480-1 [Araneus ventricosus]